MPHTSDSVVAKLIENWWTNANERSFQYQFAFQLASEGFDVLHVTRHCSMEFGKDIIARAPDGKIHGYQLKSGFGERMKLGEWQKLSSQVDTLVVQPIRHPSIEGGGIAIDHQPWFVVNGYLNEEVTRDIEDRNCSYRHKFDRELKTVVLGEMVNKSIAIANSVWPTTPEINHELFSAYINDGRKPLDKSAFFAVLQSLLPADVDESNPRSINRIADSLAVVTSLYTANMAKQQNWIAQINAWMICWGMVGSLFERHRFDPAKMCGGFRLIQKILASLLEGFAEEVSKNPDLRSSESVPNQAYGVANVRTTTIVGYLAVNAIRRTECKEDAAQAMELIDKVLGTQRRLELWGEAAVPSLLAYWLVLQNHVANLGPDVFLWSITDSILDKLAKPQVYPDPYVSAEEFAIAVAKKDGVKLEQMESQRESFWFRAVIESCARQLWRQRLAQRWNEISKHANVRFEVSEPWHLLLWRSDEGTYKTEWWPEPTSWKRLKASANGATNNLPRSLKQRAWLTTLFLIVFSHRALPEAVRWIEGTLDDSRDSN